jgi:hypothetical protein
MYGIPTQANTNPHRYTHLKVPDILLLGLYKIHERSHLCVYSEREREKEGREGGREGERESKALDPKP